MKLIFLMVLFSTPSDPAPHHHPDFGAMRMNDMDHCLARRSFLQNQLERQISNRAIAFFPFCVEFTASGYDEAVDRLNRMTGRDS